MTLVHFRTALLALSVAALALTGCPGPDDDDDRTPDAGQDAGTDAGTDAGDDGDSGEEEPDPEVETGGAASSEQIQAVRDVTDEGAEHDPALSVEKVAVTYIRPLIGSDPAGFFVQAEATGPALFVAVDPATIETEFAVGDIVSFDVTGSTVAYGQHQVTGIEGLTVEDSGFDVSTLVQDLSASTDIITGLDGYESELIQVSAHMAGDIYACGGPSQCNAISTEGIPTPENNLRFRMSPEVVEEHGLRTGCDVVIGPSPMWRRNATAQVSAVVPEDVTVVSCTVEPASAIATSPTEVQITFNTELDAETVNAEAFTISGPDGALAVSAVVVDGATVTLTTAAQVSGAAYEVTVAETVKDTTGYAVAAGTTIGFTGHQAGAVIRINELELNGALGCDLIELRAIQGGSMEGFVLGDRNASPVFTFPTGFTVATNDLIVVHTGKNSADCNGGDVPEDEVDGPDTVAHAQNFAGAYDFWSTTSGIATNGGNVISLQDALGNYVDFVLHAPTSGSINGNTIPAAQAAGEAGAWSLPAEGFTSDNLRDHAAVYSTARNDGTLQRTDDSDSDDATGWIQATPGNIGELNPGQSAL